jgi:hypothetical protein
MLRIRALDSIVIWEANDGGTHFKFDSDPFKGVIAKVITLNIFKMINTN